MACRRFAATSDARSSRNGLAGRSLAATFWSQTWEQGGCPTAASPTGCAIYPLSPATVAKVGHSWFSAFRQGPQLVPLLPATVQLHSRVISEASLGLVSGRHRPRPIGGWSEGHSCNRRCGARSRWRCVPTLRDQSEDRLQDAGPPCRERVAKLGRWLVGAEGASQPGVTREAAARHCRGARCNGHCPPPRAGAAAAHRLRPDCRPLPPAP